MILNGVYPIVTTAIPTDECAFCNDVETTDHFF